MCVKTQTLTSQKLNLVKNLSVYLEAEREVKPVASWFTAGSRHHLPVYKTSKLFVSVQ